MRGCQRQGSSEISAPGALYAVDFRRTEEKIRPERLPPAAADCAWGVRWMETRSRNEDDKLSTEPGQLQRMSQRRRGRCDRESGRRVRVTPLTRRCRANTRMCERPGQTENTMQAGRWKDTR